MRHKSTCYVKGKSDGSSEAIVGGEGLIRCPIRVVTTHNELGPKIHWVEMPLNQEEKEARTAWLESNEEGMRRCDEAECNNQPKVSAGNNATGEVRPAITKREDQRSKTVDPRKDEGQ